MSKKEKKKKKKRKNYQKNENYGEFDIVSFITS